MGESQLVLVKAKWRTKSAPLKEATNTSVVFGLACDQVTRNFRLEINLNHF